METTLLLLLLLTQPITTTSNSVALSLSTIGYSTDNYCKHCNVWFLERTTTATTATTEPKRTSTGKQDNCEFNEIMCSWYKQYNK